MITISSTVTAGSPPRHRTTRSENRAPTAVAMSNVNSDTDSDRVGKPSSSANRWIIEISMSMNPSPSDAK